MLLKSRRPFVELIVVGYFMAECTILLEGNVVLSNTMSYFPYEKTYMGKVQNENLQHTKQPFETANENGNYENKRYYIGRLTRQEPKIWDQWGHWSSCSVTCGTGKIARWRHCIAGSCSVGEKKAQLKTCTLAAC